ncbi:hypothetical protein FB45DRAFT_889619 [Roridomyces roridus]|uniref:Secreted protein n=1 Tax=Roridomyces roridus TaxID=1738132 RepID=A0AAD7CKI1_9AGAR|nr:hypothetical protein FB45DRAFT_889619 [Roridomyces roridus]
MPRAPWLLFDLFKLILVDRAAGVIWLAMEDTGSYPRAYFFDNQSQTRSSHGRRHDPSPNLQEENTWSSRIVAAAQVYQDSGTPSSAVSLGKCVSIEAKNQPKTRVGVDKT